MSESATQGSQPPSPANYPKIPAKDEIDVHASHTGATWSIDIPKNLGTLAAFEFGLRAVLAQWFGDLCGEASIEFEDLETCETEAERMSSYLSVKDCPECLSALTFRNVGLDGGFRIDLPRDLTGPCLIASEVAKANSAGDRVREVDLVVVREGDRFEARPQWIELSDARLKDDFQDPVETSQAIFAWAKNYRPELGGAITAPVPASVFGLDPSHPAISAMREISRNWLGLDLFEAELEGSLGDVEPMDLPGKIWLSVVFPHDETPDDRENAYVVDLLGFGASGQVRAYTPYERVRGSVFDSLVTMLNGSIDPNCITLKAQPHPNSTCLKVQVATICRRSQGVS